MPCVSVIVPVHDAQDYLAECLASIERQTLDDIEVICIDDASTDESAFIIRCFAEADERFKLVSFAENRGVAAARNEGIERACADWVVFIDADDWYPEDETLEKLYRAAVDHGVVIAGGMMSVYDMETGELRWDYKDAGHLGQYYFEESRVMPYREWQGDYGFMRFMYNREFLVSNGLRFPLLIRHEDPVFLVKAMLAAGSFYALAEVVYRYRINHKSYELSEKAISDAVEGLVEMLALAQVNDLPELKKWTVETLRWYLATQTPEVRAQQEKTARLEEEVCSLRRDIQSLLDSRTYRLGEIVAKPLWALRDAMQPVRGAL